MKVEFFLSSRIKDIEKEINEFIKVNNIDFVDIKIQMAQPQVLCVLVYEEKE